MEYVYIVWTQDGVIIGIWKDKAKAEIVVRGREDLYITKKELW